MGITRPPCTLCRDKQGDICRRAMRCRRNGRREFAEVPGGRVTAQAIAVLHLAPPVERRPSCVLLPHLIGEGGLQIGWATSQLHAGIPRLGRDLAPGPRLHPLRSLRQVLIPAGEAVEYLISSSAMCRLSELITVVGLVGVPLQIPAPVVVQRPQLTPTLEAAQLRRCLGRPLGGGRPADISSSTSAWPAALPLSSLLMPNRSLTMFGNISQFRGTRSFCSALSWALSRSPSRLVWFSSQRLSARCPRPSVLRTRDRCVSMHQNEGWMGAFSGLDSVFIPLFYC